MPAQEISPENRKRITGDHFLRGEFDLTPPFLEMGSEQVVFGFRVLRSVVQSALHAPVPSGSSRYTPNSVRREAEFVSCLINGADERLTFDLRFLSQPDPKNPAAGRLQIGLLVKARGMSRIEVTNHALTLGNLLQAMFPELEFLSMSVEEFRLFLEPFPVRHGILISRRWGWEPLDSLRSGTRQKPPIGFGDHDHAKAAIRSRKAVFHVFSFSCPFGSMDAFFRLLLLHPWPCLASVGLRPTRLQPEEEAFLEGEIALCERFAQASINQVSEELRVLQPTLQERARLHQRRLLRKLHALKDDACLMSIALVSSHPVPQLLADVWGHCITRPASEDTRDDPWSCLDGGYQTFTLHDISRVAHNVKNVELTVPSSHRETTRLLYLFDASEAAAAFRLPPASEEGLPGVESRRFRWKDVPPTIPQDGICFALGKAADRQVPVRLTEGDRLRHVYIAGQTGTGKTTLLRQMILEDIRGGKGVCLIDPHGDLFAEVLGLIPDDREDDVVVIDPTDQYWSVGLNLLEVQKPEQRHFVVQQLSDIITRLLEDEFGIQASHFTGPIFYYHLRMGTLLACSNPERPGTLLDVYRIFTIPDYWKNFWDDSCKDVELQNFINANLRYFVYDKKSTDGINVGDYFFSKLANFVFDPRIRAIFGQKCSTVNLRALMDEGKIVLVNLAKGLLSEGTARFFGMVVLAKLQSAAMERVLVPVKSRRPFYVYVDEFQSLATETFTVLLSEGRKFGLGLVLANQFISQVKQMRIMQSVFGNVGTLVAFRLGAPDAEVLEPYFKPSFDFLDLTSLPNWHAVVRLLVNGQAEPPFTAVTIPPTQYPSSDKAKTIRKKSAKAYARRRDHVEKELEGPRTVEPGNFDPFPLQAWGPEEDS